jgi:hypothetical protein
VISALDVATLPGNTELQAIQEVEVPDVGPQALAYLRHPSADSTGVSRRRWLFSRRRRRRAWAVSRSVEGLFQSPPVACGDQSFQRIRIDRPGSDATWTWKRCVDVAVVEAYVTAGPAVALRALRREQRRRQVHDRSRRSCAATRLQPDGSTPLYATVLLPADETLRRGRGRDRAGGRSPGSPARLRRARDGVALEGDDRCGFAGRGAGSDSSDDPGLPRCLRVRPARP